MERILLAMKDKENLKTVSNFLENNFTLMFYENGIDTTALADLVIADEGLPPFLRENAARSKKDQNAILRPLLLIAPKEGISFIGKDDWMAADEVISSPVNKMELYTRIEALLRMRKQSMLLAEQRLLQDGDGALLANEQLMSFFSILSHELKTPLAVVLSCLEFLSVSMANDFSSLENCRNTLEISKRNTLRLLRIINNIIDLTKLKTGNMKAYLHNTDIRRFLEGVVDSVQAYAREKEIKLVFLAEEPCAVIAVDQNKLERVLFNLLSNALKFTPRNGKVTVSVGNSPDRKSVMIAVRDTGIGMPQEKLRGIFEAFSYADGALSKRADGCGLGLALVKSLAELQGWGVRVESKLGIGSKFCVELPVRTVEADALAEGSFSVQNGIAYEFSEID